MIPKQFALDPEKPCPGGDRANRHKPVFPWCTDHPHHHGAGVMKAFDDC
jgi:hypothetical protein